jgi:hypothetical protein
MSLQAVGPVVTENATDGGTGDGQGEQADDGQGGGDQSGGGQGDQNGGGEATGTPPTVEFDGVDRTARGNGRVDFELRTVDGDLLDTGRAQVEDDEDDASVTLRTEGDRVRGEYRIVVTVVDRAGNTDTIERTVGGSG